MLRAPLSRRIILGCIRAAAWITLGLSTWNSAAQDRSPAVEVNASVVAAKQAGIVGKADECENLASTHQLICSSESLQTIWVFTQPGHPAHPAFVERKMVMANGHVGIDRYGEFAGSKTSYVSWWHEFDPLDVRQIHEWERILKSRPSRN